ncbi:MAG TPA: 4-hydroxy-3-methylbut-2-enyl diphosphate reductase, partial [Actinomycetota bacterium]|nr:4-hydroxy-3-methylbut-2-enyl diphosphate reductase [Actinomycetota bacterium]
MTIANGERLTVLVPLAIERSALRGRLPDATMMRVGMGPERARTASAGLTPGAGPVAVAGFCGALAPGIEPGDVVVASEIRGPDGDTIACAGGPLVAALRRMGIPGVHYGPVASAEKIVRGDGRAALAETGAIAVDMESYWAVRAAGDRPVAVLRAVSDSPERELGPNLGTVTGGMTAYRSLRRAAPALAEWGRAAGSRTVLLAGPRSFCAGVERAIQIVERALDRFGPPVYVRKQIVHNVHVVQDLERRGAVFVDEIEDVPEGAVTVFSAHGVSPQVRAEAEGRELKVIDATCPLVTKVHTEARRFAAGGYRIVLVGHEGHEEVEGTTGEAPEAIQLIGSADEIDRLEVGDGDRVAYLTQTTLAVDEVEDVIDRLRQRFPSLAGPGSDDICYATTNRQDAVKALARESDLMLVIGSENSSN